MNSLPVIPERESENNSWTTLELVSVSSVASLTNELDSPVVNKTTMTPVIINKPSPPAAVSVLEKLRKEK